MKGCLEDLASELWFTLSDHGEYGYPGRHCHIHHPNCWAPKMERGWLGVLPATQTMFHVWINSCSVWPGTFKSVQIDYSLQSDQISTNFEWDMEAISLDRVYCAELNSRTASCNPSGQTRRLYVRENCPYLEWNSSVDLSSAQKTVMNDIGLMSETK